MDARRTSRSAEFEFEIGSGPGIRTLNLAVTDRCAPFRDTVPNSLSSSEHHQQALFRTGVAVRMGELKSIAKHVQFSGARPILTGPPRERAPFRTRNDFAGPTILLNWSMARTPGLSKPRSTRPVLGGLTTAPARFYATTVSHKASNPAV